MISGAHPGKTPTNAGADVPLPFGSRPSQSQGDIIAPGICGKMLRRTSDVAVQLKATRLSVRSNATSPPLWNAGGLALLSRFP
jgi:hypothetical protein